MKQPFFLFLVIGSLFSSLAFAELSNRGVQKSSDAEIKTSKAKDYAETAGESDYDNNPIKINQQRMEANPQGTKSNPRQWPSGSAMESGAGETIQD